MNFLMTDPAIIRRAELIAQAFKLKSEQNNAMDCRALRKFEGRHPPINHSSR